MPRRAPKLAIRWAPLAFDRAAEHARYIAAERPVAAERWLDELVRLVGGLATAPRRGRMVPEIGRPDLREIFHGAYRVIYRLEPKRIAILTIRHARQQFDARELGEG